ncbi:hypothetical protein [Bradyrhizobium prioriisuperbiae]|nr:hypothetical protein [Bradyrhizobium prioritasuperba]
MNPKAISDPADRDTWSQHFDQTVVTQQAVETRKASIASCAEALH